jgi:rSAM/selenodomain-associated transferase 1
VTFDRGVIAVFAKRPESGRVKTRMCPPLTPEQAAQLYACLLDDALEATSVAARQHGLEAVLAVHPAESCGELSGRCPPAFRVVAQRGPDLAARMEYAVAEAAAGGARRILLRGSDSPTLDSAVIGETLEALDGFDVVVCPDRDGGYSLIGLKEPVPGLFSHPMSTGNVLDDTLANAERAALKSHVLAPRFDLDSIGDLRWLAEARRDADPATCPRTLTFLDEYDIWRLVPSRLRASAPSPLAEAGQKR